jgi:hypothetical protein
LRSVSRRSIAKRIRYSNTPQLYFDNKGRKIPTTTTIRPRVSSRRRVVSTRIKSYVASKIPFKDLSQDLRLQKSIDDCRTRKSFKKVMLRKIAAQVSLGGASYLKRWRRKRAQRRTIIHKC